MAKLAKKKQGNTDKKQAPRKKSWQEKLHVNRVPEVETTNKKFADIPAGARMLIATPLMVEEYIRQIPRGQFREIGQIRKDLAADNHADYTCPVTTGIFIRIVAEAAYEEYMQGKSLSRIAPFWRALSPRSPSAKKLSFGMDFLLERRKKEGIFS